MIKFSLKLDSKAKNLITEIETLSHTFSLLKIHPEQINHLHRESLLKSSLYSARIEGNSLTLEKVRLLTHSSKTIERLEISNLLSAYQKLPILSQKPLSTKKIKDLHSLVMKNLSPNAGRFRTDPWAIFNQAGVAIYLAPPSTQVPILINELIDILDSKTYPPLVSAAIAQFIFEKIHPFADGNGRVGRLISAFILQNAGYSFAPLISVEEYIENHREEYYTSLEPDHNCSDFITFYLTALNTQINTILAKISQPLPPDPEISLLPRRQELLGIIRDHPNCSFDFISRRFLQVNPKTLHNDLLQLQKQGFILKLGRTKGSVYTSKN